MAAPRLVLVILAVRNVDSMTTFYARMLGWPQIVDTPAYREFESLDGLRLGLYTEAGFGRNIGVVPEASPPLTRTELYIHCDALYDAIDRAVAAGARPLSPVGPREWGDEAAYFADPEGNIVVLARPLSS